MCTKAKLVKKECQGFFFLSVVLQSSECPAIRSQVQNKKSFWDFYTDKNGTSRLVTIVRSQAACNNDPTIGSPSGTASKGYCGIHLLVNPLDAICRIWKKVEEGEGQTGACLTGSMAQTQGEERELMLRKTILQRMHSRRNT